MASYKFTPIDIGGYIVDAFYVDDNRGYFTKLFENDIFQKAGIIFNVSETFVSCSHKNVVRGMHFQTFHPQTKLISVISGEIYDVIIDLRKDSSTYGQWRGDYLSLENHKSLLVPKGFAHGYVSLCDDTMVMYQCDGEYDKQSDTGIFFDDRDIAVEWPIDTSKILVGSRDKNLMSFEEFDKRYSFVYSN